ncbi:MAG: hypothetical protein WCL24_10090 [Verrucomicrobiota bacterium]
MPDRLPPPSLRLLAALLGSLLAGVPAARAQSDAGGSSPSAWDISDLLDHLPTVSPFGKFNAGSPFPIKYYARPRLGDFFHRRYLRLPVGARAQLSEHVELSTELEGYFTHGLKDPAGYGLSRLRVGGKYEEVMSPLHRLGWSTGADFETPLSRPPLELTDGHRHLLPYLAFSRVLAPDCHLVGYTGASADFLSHTPLPIHFGHNQLHSNSTTLGAGLTRDWSRFRVALTGTWSTTALLSDEGHHLFALRPDILIPLTRKPGPGARTHLLLIVGGRAVHGPDGNELGVNASLRIEFAVRSGHPDSARAYRK